MDMKESKTEVTISIASLEQKDIIKNLYNLYLHDLSEFADDVETDERGFFVWDSEEMYWENASLKPIIVKYEDKPIGFILLSEPPYTKPGCDYCIQEFFILRKYRGKGLSVEAINQLFKTYKGIYCLLILEGNIKALKFWCKLHERNNVEFEEGIAELKYGRCYYHVFKV